MAKKENKPSEGIYPWKRGEKKLFDKRKKRLEKMLTKKTKLGIDDKCDRMDALYTPHLTTLEDSNQFQIQTSDEFLNDAVLVEKSRKSMPLAFEKITTAQAILIKENPKCIMKASSEKHREDNFFIQNVYYENFAQQKKKEVARKYVYHLTKYGIGYWREYIKKTYRKNHEHDDKGKLNTTWKYDVFDVVAENIHPKNVLLDDNCISVKDVNRPAFDCAIVQYLTEDEFEALYPSDVFDNSKYVKENQAWMLNVSNYDASADKTAGGKTKIQVICYENRFEDLREIWANCTPIESVPLPGHELSLNGDKFIEDLDNYDGIGIGQVIEIYLPIVDDIVNCSLERLRQIVRPNEDWFNGVDVRDEADDVSYGSGSVRKLTGDPTNIKYSQPPSRSQAEANEKEEMMQEIDRASMIPRDLSGAGAGGKVKTAYQAAQNRETALAKMSLPLASIKKTLEDAANLSLSLFQIAYAEPLETVVMKPGDEEFDEGMAIIMEAEQLGIEDERAVMMDDGNIARRKFRSMELPMNIESSTHPETGQITGRIIESDEKKFWEILPKNLNWKGQIEIIGESFLPVSKALDDEQNKETIEYLMNIPITDQMGKPTLTNAAGEPYTIDKVRLAKDRCRMNRNFDPDRYVIPLNQQNQGQGNIENSNPLESSTDLSKGNLVNQTRPETANLPA